VVANRTFCICQKHWLGIKSVVQTFTDTDEEIRKLEERYTEREIGEIIGLLDKSINEADCG
jgi:hypothetical protein